MYYVVRTSNQYSVWEMTQEQMAKRTSDDPTLKDRMDRAPFKTKEEAERRRFELENSK